MLIKLKEIKMNNEIKLNEWQTKNITLDILDEVYMINLDGTTTNLRAAQNIAYNMMQDLIRYNNSCTPKAILLRLDEMTDKRRSGSLKDDLLRNKIKAVKIKYMKQLNIKF